MFTYFFYDSRNGLTKIGKSRHPVSRFEALSKGRDLSPVCVLGGDVEKVLHSDFAALRVEGEWFNLDESARSKIAGTDGNLIAFDHEGFPIIPGSSYAKRKVTGVLVQIELEDDMLKQIDALAEKERRSRKGQVVMLLKEALKTRQSALAEKP